jgi:hypothetical protein
MQYFRNLNSRLSQLIFVYTFLLPTLYGVLFEVEVHYPYAPMQIYCNLGLLQVRYCLRCNCIQISGDIIAEMHLKGIGQERVDFLCGHFFEKGLGIKEICGLACTSKIVLPLINYE